MTGQTDAQQVTIKHDGRRAKWTVQRVDMAPVIKQALITKESGAKIVVAITESRDFFSKELERRVWRLGVHSIGHTWLTESRSLFFRKTFSGGDESAIKNSDALFSAMLAEAKEFTEG